MLLPSEGVVGAERITTDHKFSHSAIRLQGVSYHHILAKEAKEAGAEGELLSLEGSHRCVPHTTYIILSYG